MQLQGKTALITGATTGIGFATAQSFIAEGVKALVITGQDEDRLESAHKTLSSSGVPVNAIRWRADQPEDSVTLAAKIKADHESLDIVFANAGVCWPAPLDQISAEITQKQFMINFTGPILLMQALTPLINDGGSVVFNTSCLDELGMAGMTVYAASKAALRSAARTLSAELGHRQIRVNAVAPGPIETPIYSKLGMAAEDLDQMAAGIIGKVPAGRFGKPEEVAAAVLFLASDSSSYMRGTELEVDGGWMAL